MAIPILIRIALIGPTSENNAKNNIENAEAIIRLGRYITVLKNLLPFSFNLTSENHCPRRSDTIICGMKPITHMISVFAVYFKRLTSEKIVL